MPDIGTCVAHRGPTCNCCTLVVRHRHCCGNEGHTHTWPAAQREPRQQSVEGYGGKGLKRDSARYLGRTSVGHDQQDARPSCPSKPSFTAALQETWCRHHHDGILTEAGKNDVFSAPHFSAAFAKTRDFVKKSFSKNRFDFSWTYLVEILMEEPNVKE